MFCGRHGGGVASSDPALLPLTPLPHLRLPSPSPAPCPRCQPCSLGHSVWLEPAAGGASPKVGLRRDRSLFGRWEECPRELSLREETHDGVDFLSVSSHIWKCTPSRSLAEGSPWYQLKLFVSRPGPPWLLSSSGRVGHWLGPPGVAVSQDTRLPPTLLILFMLPWLLPWGYLAVFPSPFCAGLGEFQRPLAERPRLRLAGPCSG